jgi:hypothetical protein
VRVTTPWRVLGEILELRWKTWGRVLQIRKSTVQYPVCLRPSAHFRRSGLTSRQTGLNGKICNFLSAGYGVQGNFDKVSKLC